MNAASPPAKELSMADLARLRDQLAKLDGLPPYDGTGNIVRDDGIFMRSIEREFGAPINELRRRIATELPVGAPKRYQLLQITYAAGEGSEHVMSSFDCLYDACDEAYRVHKQFPRTVHVVQDAELDERWSYNEMIAGGFSSACTEQEWLAARRTEGLSVEGGKPLSREGGR